MPSAELTDDMIKHIRGITLDKMKLLANATSTRVFSRDDTKFLEGLNRLTTLDKDDLKKLDPQLKNAVNAIKRFGGPFSWTKKEDVLFPRQG